MEAREVDALAARIADALRPQLKEMARQAVREELAAPACGGSPHDDFFRRLNEEIMGSLGDIYREIASFQAPAGGKAKVEGMAHAGELMDEASQRLDQVIQATEKATFEIIELVERNMHAPEELLAMVADGAASPESKAQATALCRRLSDDLVEIMTCLSFQDLTGQRIKRVIDMLAKVCDMIAELYVSTGLLVKARELAPAQPLEELKKDARAKVSQAEVDDLLAQLNL